MTSDAVAVYTCRCYGFFHEPMISRAKHFLSGSELRIDCFIAHKLYPTKPVLKQFCEILKRTTNI